MTQGFTVENWKLKLARYPTEDSYSINNNNNNNIFAVADGVTRDPLEYLPDINTLKGKIEFTFNYPRPSPAKEAADLFCETFPAVLRDYNKCNRNEFAIKEAFKESNNGIKQWNKQNIPNPNYIMDDFAGCVASGVYQNDGFVHWGYLCDCGVAIFDEKGNLKFKTEDQGPSKFDKYFWKDKRLQDISWGNPKARKIIRSEYRNNPSEKYSYGVLTGEKTAISYVRTGTNEIGSNEHLIVYSDGLEDIIFSEKFADKLRKRDIKGLKKLCQKRVKTEGTLILKT